MNYRNSLLDDKLIVLLRLAVGCIDTSKIKVIKIWESENLEESLLLKLPQILPGFLHCWNSDLVIPSILRWCYRFDVLKW